MENKVSVKSVSGVELCPGFIARMIHTKHATYSYVEVNAGATIALHKHPEEQVLNLISGDMSVTVGEETTRCTAGDVVVIPGDVLHAVTAITDCLALDVFTPARLDYGQHGFVSK